MELTPVYIPIHKVDHVRHACLGLEGTILLFSQRQAAIDSEMLIPVELVTVEVGSRYKGRRLIGALLALLLPTLLCGLCGLVFFGSEPAREVETNAAFGILSLLFAPVFLAGGVVFLVLLVMFFFRVQTVRLRIEPAGTRIEFYRHRRDAVGIDEFLGEIRERQALVAESPGGSASKPIVLVKEHSVAPRLAALLWLASLPALLTAWAALLILPAGVLGWFGYCWFQYERQPRTYRQGVRHYLRGEYDRAIEVLQSLLGRLPEYVPARFRLVEAFMRAGRFEEALEVVSSLARNYPEAARIMESDIWLLKRLERRRDLTA